MDPFALPPFRVVLDAASTGLASVIDVLAPFFGSFAAVAVVVLLTLAVRALLIPVGVSQARAEQARARLAPKLRALQERWRRQPERLQRETMKLYADEKTTPWAGCLPLLAQAPVVGMLYTLFIRPEIGGQANTLLAHTLAGVPLGLSPLAAVQSGGWGAAEVIVFGVLIAVLLAVGEVSRRVFRVAPATDAPLPGVAQTMSAMHYLTAVFALFVPLAAGLYLAVTTMWTLGQRVVLKRRFPVPAV